MTKRPLPILPINRVNLITGKNSVLYNIYRTWPKPDMCVELYRDGEKIKAIFGHGRKEDAAASCGDLRSFEHDQTGAMISSGYGWEFVEAINIEDLPARAKELDITKTVYGYVYK